MRFAFQAVLAAAALVGFTACGERIPPQVSMKTDQYVGSWILESDLAANIDAADGGTGKIRVLNIATNLDMTEEVRVAGQPAPDAIYVGKLFVRLNKPAQMNFEKAKLTETKVERHSDADIERMTKSPREFSLSVDRKSAVVTETLEGVEKLSPMKYVKIDQAQREKLKLKPVPTRPDGTKPATPPPGRPAGFQDPRMGRIK